MDCFGLAPLAKTAAIIYSYYFFSSLVHTVPVPSGLFRFMDEQTSNIGQRFIWQEDLVAKMKGEQ
ncbi:MAG: hypothetical protein FWG92_06210 [Leptospirales bacterium]|nr:hypothetical protein [Leptospirales bacterium]